MRFVTLCLTLLLIFIGAPALAGGAGNLPVYGDNAQAGGYAKINGIKMYYELYGAGEPLVLIHGNGDSIAAMQHQIKYFARNHRVLVADSRGHGKSSMGSTRLTYEQMANDWSTLMDKLEIESADILGWSDGGNIALLMALRHPAKLNKLAIMGANLQPGDEAVYAWARNWVSKESKNIDAMLKKGDKSQNWEQLKQRFGLLREQPNIPMAALSGIATPVLVMAGDRDIIRTEHTLAMFRHLPNAQLAIFPGETHYAPRNHPQIFNTTVARFFTQAFSKPDTQDLF